MRPVRQAKPTSVLSLLIASGGVWMLVFGVVWFVVFRT
jgi:hypothetical protein